MTTVADVLKFIETLAPPERKMEWDNVGLNCGIRTAPVRKIMVALDPFAHVCQEAAYWEADLLVTHHPLIFRSLSAVTDDTPITRGMMTLLRNGISHICAHTNLDCALGGVNDALAQALGLQNIAVLDVFGGMLRCGNTEEQNLDSFLAFVKTTLHCQGLRYCDGGKIVRKVAVGGGACADGLYDVIRAGCDTFVTADVKYNQFWDAKEQGLNLIDAGHFHTENPVVPVLAEKLRCQFPGVAVKISESHWDIAKFF